MRRYVWLILGLCFCVCRNAMGNGAYVEFHGGIGGGAVRPEKTTAIAMVNEMVNIDVSSYSHFVKADFVFLNQTEGEQKITIGFPFDYYLFSSDRDDDSDNEMVRHRLEPTQTSLQEYYRKRMLVTVDGETPEITFSRIEKKDSLEHPIFYRIWACWPVHFYNREEKSVTVAYSLPNNTQINGDKDPETHSMLYFLRSGRTWNALLESSTIRLHYSFDPEGKLHIYPNNYVQDETAHTVTWQFRGEIPDSDIYFGDSDPFNPGFEAADKERKKIWDLEIKKPEFVYPASSASRPIY